MSNHSSRPKRPRDVNQLAKAIVDQVTGEADALPACPSEPDEAEPPGRQKDPAAVSLGRRGGLKGGKARAKMLTKEQREESARRAANVRWRKQEE